MRILLADDHDLVRETLSMFMTAEGDAVVTAVSRVEEVLLALRTQPEFDLIMLDYNMPGMDGLSGLEAVIAQAPDTPVALLSGDAPTSVVDRALEAGAAGFVPKTMGAKSMLSAIRFMIAGETFLPFDYAAKTKTDDDTGLTPRETEVLQGLALGKANKEIARDLGLQEVTIKLHVKTLSRKLGARNRTHAAMIARDRNLL